MVRDHRGRLAALAAHLRVSSAAATNEAVEEYRAHGLEWSGPAERLLPPTQDISCADNYAIPDPPQRGPGGRDANSPLGKQVQGYAKHAPHPIFDPRTQFEEAFHFYQENGFVVIPLLSEQEVAELNVVCDEWTMQPDRITLQGQGDLVFPLVHYPEVDSTVVHPNQKALIGRILGGWEHARMIEFNYRGWDPKRHAHDLGMTYHPDCAAGISLQEYSTRQPYGPPDNLLSFFYLTDVDVSTPCFSVVPKSRRAANIQELKGLLGDEYCEVPILGPAGSCCIMDANIIHTRLDPIDPKGEPKGRRIFHHVFANARLLENADGTPRTPNVPLGIAESMFSRGVAGPRLTESADLETRRLYSWWSSTQHSWKAAGYDPDFIGDPKAARGPTRGTFSHPGPYQQEE